MREEMAFRAVRLLMERASAPSGLLFGPPLGTRVHDWLLVDCVGHGAYGVVYRAVRIGQESAEPVALTGQDRPTRGGNADPSPPADSPVRGRGR